MAGHYRVAVASAQGRPARSDARHHSGRRGHAAAAASRRRGESARHGASRGNRSPRPRPTSAGSLDAVLDGDLLTGAVAFAEREVAAGGPHPKTSERTDKLGTPAGQRAAVRRRARDSRARSSRTAGAAAAIDAIEAATRLPFAEGCAARDAALPRGGSRRAGQGAAARVLRRTRRRQDSRAPRRRRASRPCGASASSAPGPWAAASRWPARTRGSRSFCTDASHRGPRSRHGRRSSATTRSRSRASASRRTRSPSAWPASRRSSTWRDSRPPMS